MQRNWTQNDLLAAVAKKEGWMLARLKELVSVESPSDDKAAVDEAVTLVAKWCAELDGRVKRHRQKQHGDLLEVWFGPTRSKRKPLMLLGHLDTVWPKGSLKQMPFRVADGRVWGPGTLDMKAGVAMMLAALAVVQEKALLEQPVVMLLHSDEEIGSPVSRALTEKVAKKCAAVFVLEPAQGLAGAYKTARKGVGDYHLRVKGIAAHSGVDFTSGHSAVLELARLLGKVSTFTDLQRGITVNPGVIGGGTRSNVVAAEAWADVDVRIAKAADATRVDKLFRGLKCKDKQCVLEVTGGVNRPPMERKPGTVKLFKQAQKLAKEMGIALDEAATGGGSDGNFTAGLGIPTLDGMGVVGEGAHARHESFLVEQLVPRTALLAGMLLRVE